MASLSATFLLGSNSSVKPNTQVKSSLKLFSPTAQRAAFPSLRLISRSRVSCMAKPDTVEKVVEIVRSKLALPQDKDVTPQSTFTDLGADSLDTVDIVMELEEAFGISVEEEHSQNIANIQDAADLIDNLVQQKAAVI